MNFFEGFFKELEVRIKEYESLLEETWIIKELEVKN